MTATATEPFGEHITDARDTDLGTRNGQLRHLVAHLGITRAQAKRLLVAWLLDLADERREQAFRERLGNDEHLPREVFLRRLMAAPDYRKPHVRKWQVGEGGGWGTRS